MGFRTLSVTGELDEVPDLIEEGRKFTYQNFSSKSVRGWLVWTHRVAELLEFFPEGPIEKQIRAGVDVPLLGQGEDDFQRAKTMIMNGLSATEKLLGSTKNIPAADRTVALDHNSQTYLEANDSLEKLIQSVREVNEYPADEEDKEQKLAELTAGQQLIAAARVRVQAVKALLEPPLRWFMEKFAGAIVGKFAEVAWKAIQQLLGL